MTTSPRPDLPTLPPLPEGWSATLEPGSGVWSVYDGYGNLAMAAMWSDGTVTAIAMHPNDLLAVLVHLKARAERGEA